ncbi:MAG: helix-turn-helix domain-containing protein, partial [Brevinematia bacterium]
EAAVNRISAFVSFKKGELNLSTLKTLLKDLIETNTKEEVIEITYTFDEIVKAVAKYYEISYEKIIDNSRTDQLMFARQVAMYLIKRLTNLTFSQIAERFGKVHSTAMRAYERIDSLIKRDLLIKQQIKEIISILKSTKNY